MGKLRHITTLQASVRLQVYPQSNFIYSFRSLRVIWLSVIGSIRVKLKYCLLIKNTHKFSYLLYLMPL